MLARYQSGKLFNDSIVGDEVRATGVVVRAAVVPKFGHPGKDGLFWGGQPGALPDVCERDAGVPAHARWLAGAWWQRF